MADVIPGMTFGAWTVLRAEGRGAWVICQCQTTRLVALEALQTGESQNCGCMNSRSTRPAPRHVTFANEIAGAELRSSQRRHQGGGIK